MIFKLFVEGHTEQVALPSFFKRWLDPRLTRPVGIRAVRFEGWRNYMNDIVAKVHLHLSGEYRSDVIAAIGLTDLFGPDHYPAHAGSASDRYSWAKIDSETRVGHPDFRQHFAVHETEAWILSDPSVLPVEVRSALPGKIINPETINFTEPPSQLLARLYRERLRRSYRKTTDGANLFMALDPNVAYGRCPHLRTMLDEMLELALAALA